jgi:hypothetical protein
VQSPVLSRTLIINRTIVDVAPDLEVSEDAPNAEEPKQLDERQK